jgi:hypothetical protein
MRVQEADDVASLFFSLQNPGPIEVNAGTGACSRTHPATIPDPAAALTDQRPAFFNRVRIFGHAISEHFC